MNQEMNEKKGIVQIADDVIMIVAGLAATDVKGVSSLAGGIDRARVATTNIRNLQKSLKVSVNNGVADIRIAINVKADISIPEVCRDVQNKVSDAVESMVGLKAGTVSVTVAGVEL